MIETHCLSKQELTAYKQEQDNRLESMAQSIDLKGNRTSIANALHRKANKADIQKLEQNFVQKSSEIKENIDRLLNDIANVNSESKKIIQTEFKAMFEKEKSNLNKAGKGDEIKQIQKEMADLSSLMHGEIQSLKVRSEDAQSEIPGDFQEQIKKFFRDYALELYGASILEISDTSLSLKTIFDKIIETQISKLDVHKTSKTIIEQATKKVERQFQESLREEVEELETQINLVRSQVKAAAKKRLNDPEGEKGDSKSVEKLMQRIEAAENKVELKSNISDVCALLDRKADSGDVFKVLDQMQKSIQLFSGQTQHESSSTKMMENFLKEQKFINENLCPLNCVA